MKTDKSAPNPRIRIISVVALLTAFLLPFGLARFSGGGSASGGRAMTTTTDGNSRPICGAARWPPS